jgi:hypothetical protein
MKHFAVIAALTILAACAGERSYKTPTFDNPSRMSADTLCYRAAYAKSSQALKDEVRARNLDCAAILEQQPAFDDRGY